MAVATTERCPWCGSLISHDRFVKIQAEIRDEERRKLAATEKDIRTRLEKEIAAQQKAFLRERQAIDAEKAKLNKQIEQIRQQAEKQVQKQIAEARQILQKDRENALLQKDAQFAREREALQKKISDMTRRIQSKKGDVAEGTELNLYDELRGAFPEDQVARVGKLKTGGYIVHEVKYKGKTAGRILIDSRQRGAWQQSFVKSLRQDQTEVGADYAVLAASVFPSGRKELFSDSGVLVVAPARVAALVEVLRKALIAVHVAKLTGAERTDKLSDLFKFITSTGFKRKLSEAETLAGEALELEVAEKRAHDVVWKKRGTIMSRIKRVLREIDTEVSAIVESPRDTPLNDGGGSVVPIRPRA